MSDANRYQLVYLAETTFGEEPTGDAKVLPIVSHSLAMSSGHVASQTIRSDGNIVDRKRTTVAEAGDIAFELVYGDYDDFLQYLLRSSGWSSVQTNTGTFSISGTTWTGTGIGASISVGQWVRFKDGSTVTGYAKVLTRAADTLTVDRALGNVTGGGDEEVEMGAQIVNGTTLTTVYAEGEKVDLSNEFVQYRGLAVAGASLELRPDSLITGTFRMLGKDEISATSTFSDSTPTAATGNKTMNAVDNVNALLKGASDLAVTSFGFSVNTGVRARPEIKVLGAKSLGQGSYDAVVDVEMYFASKTEMDEYRNQTETSLALVIQDDDGNAYLIEWPNGKWISFEEPVPGQNSDIIAAGQFGAYMDSTEEVTMRIARWAA